MPAMRVHVRVGIPPTPAGPGLFTEDESETSNPIMAAKNTTTTIVASKGKASTG